MKRRFGLWTGRLTWLLSAMLVIGLATPATSVAAVAADAAPAGGQRAQDGTQRIPPNGAIIYLWNHASGRCLDADSNTIGANGTKVQLWDCLWPRLPANQLWQVSSRPGGFILQSVWFPYRCLDADINTPRDGAKVQLWDCNGSSQQLWDVFDANGGGTVLRNWGLTFRALDADTNTMGHNGTKVQVWTENYEPQQLWGWASVD